MKGVVCVGVTRMRCAITQLSVLSPWWPGGLGERVGTGLTSDAPNNVTSVPTRLSYSSLLPHNACADVSLPTCHWRDGPRIQGSFPSEGSAVWHTSDQSQFHNTNDSTGQTPRTHRTICHRPGPTYSADRPAILPALAIFPAPTNRLTSRIATPCCPPACRTIQRLRRDA